MEEDLHAKLPSWQMWSNLLSNPINASTGFKHRHLICSVKIPQKPIKISEEGPEKRWLYKSTKWTQQLQLCGLWLHGCLLSALFYAAFVFAAFVFAASVFAKFVFAVLSSQLLSSQHLSLWDLSSWPFSLWLLSLLALQLHALPMIILFGFEVEVCNFFLFSGNEAQYDDQENKFIIVPGRQGNYMMSESIHDKYTNRPIGLEHLTLS